ncbi:hypothetical protein NW762_004372 [Fusarium torreyae]|uniref:Uncharacterized protein n=1 Tax=Fusarium torreyae TaxID=1237075 RepID=A0A9W8VGU6_9HYPO|nr:hypothetical protein NW762_004372 [Fusarium torreyae]
MAFEIIAPWEKDTPGVAMPRLLPRLALRNTMDHVQSVDKGVVVARESEVGKIASFVGWNIQRQMRQGENEDHHDEEFPDCCGHEHPVPCVALSKRKRDKTLGDKTYYRVSSGV